ncbi:MAG TPA: hypothetical protein VJW51_03050 [Candidatus Acidoferrales bacterium]|nr:hypothetical protein [Candidatus Acidoferrales bacterium]
MTTDTRNCVAQGHETTLDFESWMGMRVTLRVAFAEICVPLPGTLLSETPTTLRFRIGDGWDVDIYKSMVLGIDCDSWTDIT